MVALVQTKKAKVLETLEAMQTWPYWKEVYLNCVKESPLSYEAFAQAVQAGDVSRSAFDQALERSRMTEEEFQRYVPEYQKYLALQCAYDDVGMLSDGVDQLWHAHMLISYRYSDFCMTYFGHILHHMPCSLYELYGVTIQEAKDSCLSICNPTTCKGEGGGSDGCKKVNPNVDADPQAIQRSILQSASNFVQAYTEVFEVAPSPQTWNQLTNTRRKFVAVL